MTVIVNLLDDFIDYAGLYPPAALDLRTVVRNYLCYRQTKDKFALGRLVIDLNRLEELREIAGDSLHAFRLSVLTSTIVDSEILHRFLDAGLPIDAVEIKSASLSAIELITRQLPAGLATYFEVPVENMDPGVLDAICAAGARVKLRLGGSGAAAFPSSHAVAVMLKAVAERHLRFKATAGLHHPVRGPYPFTDAPDSAVGSMHGFVNLWCAAALLYLGGDTLDAVQVLEETDRHAWKLSAETIAWRHSCWNASQAGEMRRRFFCGIGSCSFEQPLAELGALGWL